jgi:hypothetical protein
VKDYENLKSIPNFNPEEQSGNFLTKIPLDNSILTVQPTFADNTPIVSARLVFQLDYSVHRKVATSLPFKQALKQKRIHSYSE